MQDSLGDYVKVIKNPNSEEQSVPIKKEFQISAQKKRECDARALKIVEFSIEGKLRPEIFTRCNYCSNFCYKASLHIKKQIDDGPLWVRKLDDIPEYQLLGSDESGIPGEYIDQGISKPAAETSFTSVGIFTHASLIDMVNREPERRKQEKNEKPKGKHKKSKLVKTMQTITENTEHTEEDEEVIQSPIEHRGLQKSASLPVIIENEENLETKCESCENLTTGTVLKSDNKKTKKKSSKSSKTNAEEVLRKVIKEWLTLESFIFLYGESKIKEILNARKMSDCFEKLNIDKLQRDQQIKYMDICRRLHLKEIADEKFDSFLLGGTLRPLPDYNQLKQESKELNLKVKSFYCGVLHEKENRNFPTKINKTEEQGDTEEIPVVLPLVDVNSQKGLRRKIFLTALNKSMQQLLQMLRVTYFSTVLSDTQTLVKTFNLGADNIVFKPVIWNYISVILLYILALRDSNVKNTLEDKSSQEYIKLQLSILPSKEGIISEIMKDICDVESFIENYISST